MTFTITVFCHGLDSARHTWTVVLEEDAVLTDSWNGTDLGLMMGRASARLRTEQTARRRGFTRAQTSAMRQRIVNALDRDH